MYDDPNLCTDELSVLFLRSYLWLLRAGKHGVKR